MSDGTAARTARRRTPRYWAVVALVVAVAVIAGLWALGAAMDADTDDDVRTEQDGGWDVSSLDCDGLDFLADNPGASGSGLEEAVKAEHARRCTTSTAR